MENQKQSKFNKLVKISLIIAIIACFFSFLSILNIPNFNESLFEAIGFLLLIASFVIGIVASLVKREEKKFSLRLFSSFLLSVICLFSFFVLNYVYYVCRPRDTAIKSNIAGSRMAAEMWWDDQTKGKGSYEGVCNGSAFQSMSKAIEISTKKPMRCFSSKIAYCAEADLTISNEWYADYCVKSGLRKSNKWCADSSGYAGPDANCSAEHLSCQ